MKRILLLLGILFLCGCTTAQNPILPSPSPVQTPRPKPRPTEKIYPTPIPKPTPIPTKEPTYNGNLIRFSPMGYDEHYKLFQEYYAAHFNKCKTSDIDLFLGENENGIGLNFAYGLPIKVDHDKVPPAPNGNFYAYYGELTELAEGVYASLGGWCPEWNYLDRRASEYADFYVIYKNQRLYIIAEDLTLDELCNYDSEAYMTPLG